MSLLLLIETPVPLPEEAKTFSEYSNVPLVSQLFLSHLVVMGFNFTD